MRTGYCLKKSFHCSLKRFFHEQSLPVFTRSAQCAQKATAHKQQVQ